MSIPWVIRVGFERLGQGYYRLRQSPLVWYYLLNRESRKIWRQNRRELDPAQASIVDQLNREGIAACHINELFPGEGFLRGLIECASVRAGHDRKPGREPGAPAEEVRLKTLAKDFILHIWGGGGTYPVVDLSDPFIRFILAEKILGIAGSYFDLAPKLQGFSLQSTILVPPGSSPRLSQRWHRDPDDKKILKIFMYLSDVDGAGAGPFVYVQGSQACGGRWRHIFPQQPPAGSYPQDGAVEKIVPARDIRPCLGRAGTLVFCDTSGLHKGGYSTTKTRLMFAVGFVSRASLMPVNYQRPGTRDVETLSALARYAIKP